MKTNNIKNTIVGFHTGRGGRFYNAGHVKFIGECKISDFTSDLFLRYENELELYNNIKHLPNLLKKFEWCQDNNDFSFFINKGFQLGERMYFGCGGQNVGLTEKEAQEGVGVINIDNDYDTTVCVYLKDCSEDQLELILNYSGYVDYEVMDYVKECLGIAEYEE